MARKGLKVVIWCGPGANQKALVNKIALSFIVTGIVIDRGLAKSSRQSARQLLNKLYDRFKFRKIYAAWHNLMRYYDRKFTTWPDIPVLKANGINDPAVEKFTLYNQPDLVVVSGTSLVKEPLLNISLPVGIINLHTGLSPFVKGGPNCTNWCIANNEWHLTGNTIMWLNAGIDAGNIITTETIDIRNADDLNEAHQLVMDHAHELYLKAINWLANSEPPYISVPQQSLGSGRLYMSKMWTAGKRKELLKNWKNRKTVTGNYPPVKTVSLPAANE